jgi:hypothetical protein
MTALESQLALIDVQIEDARNKLLSADCVSDRIAPAEELSTWQTIRKIIEKQGGEDES